MFGKKKNGIPNIRQLIHDLRASHHAAKLNADAARLLAEKIDGKEAERLQKHIDLLNSDLDKFKVHLEGISQVMK